MTQIDLPRKRTAAGAHDGDSAGVEASASWIRPRHRPPPLVKHIVEAFDRVQGRTVR
ncbi:MAG: hypothetical protein ACLRMJ_05780 [Alistipes finegoldii]